MIARAARRCAIIFDGAHWYVRRIRSIEHDLNRDEKVYRCDAPIGRRYRALSEAIWAALKWQQRP